MADEHDGGYKCPTCQTTAAVKGRRIDVFITGRRQWPRHLDCELAKDIDHIDFSKLERIG